MTGDFYYAFTNPYKASLCYFFLPKTAIFFLYNCWVASWLHYNSSMLTNLLELAELSKYSFFFHGLLPSK